MQQCETQIQAYSKQRELPEQQENMPASFFFE